MIDCLRSRRVIAEASLLPYSCHSATTLAKDALENKSSSEAEDASAASSSGTETSSSGSLDLDYSESGSSAGSLDSADTSAGGEAQGRLVGMKKDGFEKAMQVT